MAFNRPTLSVLVQRIGADIETALGIVGATLRVAFTKLLAKVLAGVAHLLYGYLDWISLQVFPDTAEAENLRRWASVWGIVQTPAAYGAGEVTFTGTDGTEIEAETELVSSDGLRYKTVDDVTIASGEAVVAIRALAAGDDSNADVGTVLTLSIPIVGAVSEATVSSAVVGGADEETDDQLRARLLARIQTPPKGGAAVDYETWATEVAGVTRAWSYPLYLGEGTVGVFFVRDNDDSIFPSVDEVAEVSAYIETKRPVTAHQYTFAPTADPIDFTITLNPADDDEVKDAVEAELRDLIDREAEPGGLIYLSHFNEAISQAAGEVDHLLVQPSADFESTNGYLPTFGSITWS